MSPIRYTFHFTVCRTFHLPYMIAVKSHQDSCGKRPFPTALRKRKSPGVLFGVLLSLICVHWTVCSLPNTANFNVWQIYWNCIANLYKFTRRGHLVFSSLHYFCPTTSRINKSPEFKRPI